MNTGDLLRQIEALLVTHQDNKVEGLRQEMVKAASRRAIAAK
jgi:hypothetical protein